MLQIMFLIGPTYRPHLPIPCGVYTAHARAHNNIGKEA